MAHLRAVLDRDDPEVVIYEIGLGRLALECVVLDQKNRRLLHGQTHYECLSMKQITNIFQQFIGLFLIFLIR